MNSQKVSLKDIANIAGVSVSLVSMALNDNGKKYRISDELATRIRKIAKDLNYQPNFAAKSLRGGKTGVIGLLVSDISNSFFANLARSIENYAEHMNYTVVFGSSDENAEKTEKIIDVFINKGVDGLIVVPCDRSEKFIKQLTNGHTPMVLIDRTFDSKEASYICLDNKEATNTATEHLLASGYGHTGIIAYESPLQHMQNRVLGYKAAMKAHGLGDLTEVGYVHHETIKKDINVQIDKMLAKGVDSFVFASNTISIEGLKVISERNIKVPEQLGVIGFDGSEAFDLYPTPISYILQPIELMAQKSVQILLEQISSSTVIKQCVELEGVLAKKESSCRNK